MRVFDRSEQIAAEESDRDTGIGAAARVFWLSALAASALAILTIHGGALLRAPQDPLSRQNAAFSDAVHLMERGIQR